MRDTEYAKELSRASISFPGGGEGRIERLLIKDPPEEAIRFSWWKDGRMIPRPLDATESQLLSLLSNAIQAKVFSSDFLGQLQQLLVSNEQLRIAIISELLRSSLAEIQKDLNSRYADGGVASGARQEAILSAVKDANSLASEAISCLS